MVLDRKFKVDIRRREGSPEIAAIEPRLKEPEPTASLTPFSSAVQGRDSNRSDPTSKPKLSLPLLASPAVDMARKFFVGGNFKMNGTVASTKALIESLNQAELKSTVEVVIAPPALYLLTALETVKNGISVAAQNSHSAASGAFTGEISATQLKDAGIPWVIIGHSERRTLFGDTDKVVAAKTKAALDAGLSVILCIGETLEEREADKTIEVVERQLAAVSEVVKDWSKIVIAYEPVWAIGTGKVATTAQAQEVHHKIRLWLSKNLSQETAEATRIIYGGSVTDKNCGELGASPDLDGYLVGGASLKPAFVDIVNSAP